jgi:ankyrin repeat protein
MAAAWYGHAAIASALLASGANPNNNSETYEPLRLASRHGHVEVVNILLDAGASINAQSNVGWTALMSACDKSRLEIVKALVERPELDVDRTNDKGVTSFVLACQAGNIDIVSLLLQAGANTTLMRKGRSCLSYAAMVNGSSAFVNALCSPHRETAELCSSAVQHAAFDRAIGLSEFDAVAALIDGGASVDVTDAVGTTPLMRACYHAQVEAVRLLLQANGTHNLETVDTDLGFTALSFAAYPFECTDKPICNQTEMADRAQIVRMLLAAGSRHDHVVPLDGSSALFHAASVGATEIVHTLLEAGADVNLALHDSARGYTPMLVASESGKVEVMQLLYNHGADINKTLVSGSSALMLAARSKGGRPEAAALLLSWSVDANAQDSAGFTPLDYVIIRNTRRFDEEEISEGTLRTVEALLQGGADPDRHIPFMGTTMTALHFACIHAQLALVEVLLDAGASPHEALMHAGSTPLITVAVMGGSKGGQIAEALLRGGADPDTRSQSEDATALHMASDNDNVGVLRALIAANASFDALHPETARTALISASYHGHTGCVRVLLDAGANVAWADNHGRTRCWTHASRSMCPL